jgi:hypothetical protein
VDFEAANECAAWSVNAKMVSLYSKGVDEVERFIGGDGTGRCFVLLAVGEFVLP